MSDTNNSPAPSMTMTPRLWGLLVGLAALWGFSFIFAKIAVAQIGPFTLVLLRVAIAALALHIVLRIRGIRFPVTPTMLASFLTMGLLNNAIPFSLLFWGQQEVSAGLASIINASTPLFTVIMAHLMLADERLNMTKFIGVLIGLIGVAVLIGPAVFTQDTSGLWAKLAIIGTAISYSFAGIYGRRFKGQPPLITATGQLTGSTLLMIPVALMFEPFGLVFQMDWIATLSVIGLALGATAYAYLLYFRILAEAGATNAVLVTMLVPIFASLMGVAFLGEVFTLSMALGMALIVLGLTTLDGRLIQKWRRRSSTTPPSLSK